MARLIDADALKARLEPEYIRKKKLINGGEFHLCNLAEAFTTFDHMIFSAPTVDAVPVVHGRWIPKFYDDPFGGHTANHCSECDCNLRIYHIHVNYCPNCGAKMDL